MHIGDNDPAVVPYFKMASSVVGCSRDDDVLRDLETTFLGPQVDVVRRSRYSREAAAPPPTTIEIRSCTTTRYSDSRFHTSSFSESDSDSFSSNDIATHRITNSDISQHDEERMSDTA
jgi:hypothetical protein